VDDIFFSKYVSGTNLPGWLVNEVLSPEDYQSMEKAFFEPLFKKLESGFPVISLREAFRTARRDDTVSPSYAGNAIRINGISIGGLAMPFTHPQSGKPSVVFNCDRVRDKLMTSYSIYGAEKTVILAENMILTVYLHEYYHIKRQNFYRLVTVPELRKFESECWEYTCRELFEPLEKIDRLILLPASLDTAMYRAYKDGGRTTNSILWSMYTNGFYK
jgi:hypothetical protein